MNDYELRVLLDLLMVSDPWPLSGDQEKVMKDFADAESQKRGFESWVTAYHGLAP